jgi:hypothetical protein
MSVLKLRGLRHDAASTDAINLASSGNVGFGTASPSQKLHVVSDTNRAYGVVQSTATTAGPEAGLQLTTANRSFYLFTNCNSKILIKFGITF